eukprot:scaffold17001_cov45-Prasinocladus_malaysianus.AAC.1
MPCCQRTYRLDGSETPFDFCLGRQTLQVAGDDICGAVSRKVASAVIPYPAAERAGSQAQDALHHPRREAPEPRRRAQFGLQHPPAHRQGSLLGANLIRYPAHLHVNGVHMLE